MVTERRSGLTRSGRSRNSCCVASTRSCDIRNEYVSGLDSPRAAALRRGSMGERSRGRASGDPLPGGRVAGRRGRRGRARGHPGRDRGRPCAPSTTGAWPGTSARERGDLLLRVADLLERDKAAVARAESLDTGKRLVESEYDVDDVVGVFRHYGQRRRRGRRPGRRHRPARRGQPRSCTSRSASAALITPWNYPLLQTSWKVAPVPGRRQHLRAQAQRAHPAHRDPADAACSRRPACPPGVANLVLGAGAAAGAPLSEDPRVDLVSFTGGLATGKRIMASAAEHGEEGRPRAGRQEPQHRLRRRRPRGRARLRADRGVPALGPGLLGRRPAGRRGVDPRRVRRRAGRAGPSGSGSAGRSTTRPRPAR